jgi:hypothetical protein
MKVDQIEWLQHVNNEEQLATKYLGLYAMGHGQIRKGIAAKHEELARAGAVMLVTAPIKELWNPDGAFDLWSGINGAQFPRIVPAVIARNQRDCDLLAKGYAQGYAPSNGWLARALIIEDPTEPITLRPSVIARWVCASCHRNVHFDPKRSKVNCGCGGKIKPMSFHRHFDWLIVRGGDEPSSSPIHPSVMCAWRDSAASIQVPYWFDGWGAWEPKVSASVWTAKGRAWPEEGRAVIPSGTVVRIDMPVSRLVSQQRQTMKDGPGAEEYRAAMKRVERDNKPPSPEHKLQWFYRTGASRSGYMHQNVAYRELPLGIHGLIALP